MATRTDFIIPDTEVGEAFDQPFTLADRDASPIDLSDKSVTLFARSISARGAPVILRNTLAGGNDAELSSSGLGALTAHFLKAHTAGVGKYRVMISVERTATGFSRTFLGDWEVVD